MKKLIFTAALPLLLSAQCAIAVETPEVEFFNPGEQEAIGKVAADYLRAHPEILIEMSEKLQHAEEQREQKGVVEAVLANQQDLLHDPMSPVIHAGGDVALVQFFDYQCIWCSRMAPVVENLIAGDTSLRVTFKEWPIFGKQWPLSTFAARAGLAVWAEKGAEGYMKYHNALYQTGHVEGQLTRADASNAAAAAGLGDDKFFRLAPESQLGSTAELASRLGINGTPAFIVMPMKNATVENISVMFGAVDSNTLQAAIAKARSAGGTQ